jgi:hypothetical protein
MTRARWTAALAAVVIVCVTPSRAAAQTYSQSGFVEGWLTLYPQKASNDDTQAVFKPLARWDPSVKWTNWKIDASLDARTDTHEMTEATATFWDRTSKRPAFAVRRLSASWAHGPVTLEFGKQFIRWGKTDILIPTERFAPKDYLEVVTTEPLAVTAARMAIGNQKDSVEVVFTPRMTPARIPLFDQRWFVAPAQAQGFAFHDAGATFPKGAQVGARWNHIGRHLEHSLSFFQGYHYLPQFQTTVVPAEARVDVRREYPKLTSVGGDAAVPLKWFTIKGEAAWLGSTTTGAEEYVLYVLQIERQVGEWLFIGGYAGNHVTEAGTVPRFAPDQGLAQSIVGRASYTIDTNRSVTFEGVVRQNGDGALTRIEYSQASGKHLRFTGDVRIIRGDPADFLGQYRLNSSGSLILRYSF